MDVIERFEWAKVFIVSSYKMMSEDEYAELLHLARLGKAAQESFNKTHWACGGNYQKDDCENFVTNGCTFMDFCKLRSGEE